MSDQRLPWGEVFRGDDGKAARIRLEQLAARTFVLESSMRFHPPIPLGDIPDAALHLAPADLIPRTAGPPDPDALATTDLASVPGLFRWFLSSYGVYWCIEKVVAVFIHAFREDPRQGRSPVPYREF